MRTLLRISAALLLSFPSLAPAQGRVVKVIVAAPAGGNIDVIARIYTQKAAELLKESWIVENQGGGNGTIGTYFVARAAPDGATLLFSGDVHSTARLVMKNVPYDPLADFTPIARVAEAPLLFVVNQAQVRARDLAELIADVKADPKRFSFAVSGMGTKPHMAAEVFRSRVSSDVLVVPYRGTGPAIKDLMGGQVNMMVVAPPAVIQLVRSGRLRALAVTAPRRFEGAPEVPTAEEAGMPDFLFLNSYGYWGPKALSKDVVVRVNAIMRQASESPDLRRRLLELGASAKWEAPEVLAFHLSEELQRYARILKQAGVEPE
jgi:tripartite-type tricarboxylate transporter receptor subunit TctC